MNAQRPVQLPLSSTEDVLLADVAIRVQLSPTHYALAVQRYQTINNWIERVGSPLEDRVQIFYPQGSMAIDATIASKLDDDEFDIDLIAQLDMPADTPPHKMLDILERAIRGEPGSRYYDTTTRCSRCIQIQYRDMHLDVTPMVRLTAYAERTGNIYHAPERYRTDKDRIIVANPWGFAQWFKAKTPAEHAFAIAFSERAMAYDARFAFDAAQVDPVPEQQQIHEKSMALIALQLLKRWRNVQYDKRDGRCPPSVVLAWFVATNANHTSILSEELLYQARRMKFSFEQAQMRGELLRVENPACRSDVFTDRWPGSLKDQGVFVEDLRVLVRKLEHLRSGIDLTEMQEVLSELFGERPTLEAVKSLNDRAGHSIVSGQSRHQPGAGRFVIPSVSAIAATAPSIARATPKHTYFGSGGHGPDDE